MNNDHESLFNFNNEEKAILVLFSQALNALIAIKYLMSTLPASNILNEFREKIIHILLNGSNNQSQLISDLNLPNPDLSIQILEYYDTQMNETKTRKKSRKNRSVK